MLLRRRAVYNRRCGGTQGWGTNSILDRGQRERVQGRRAFHQQHKIPKQSEGASHRVFIYQGR